MTPQHAPVAEARRPSRRREEKFFTASYSWVEPTSVCLRKEGTGVNTLKSVICHRKNTSYAVVPHRIHEALSSVVSSLSYSTTPIAYGVPESTHARRRTISILATATIAFFLLPLARHTRENFARSTGSFRIAAHEFSMRVPR